MSDTRAVLGGPSTTSTPPAQPGPPTPHLGGLQPSPPDRPSGRHGSSRRPNREIPASTDDKSLVAEMVTAAAAGDARAWNRLVERFAGLVWSIARAHHLSSSDSADVSQVVWLRLVENLGRIREPGSVGAWIAAVTRNECLRVIRKTSREVPAAAQTLEVAGTDDVDVALLTGEHGAALRRALDRLPGRCSSLMRVLMADPRPSYEEISAALDIPIGSIGPTRQRCLDRLRVSPELTGIRD